MLHILGSKGFLYYICENTISGPRCAIDGDVAIVINRVFLLFFQSSVDSLTHYLKRIYGISTVQTFPVHCDFQR